MNKKNKQKNDYKNQIINRQAKEIDNLKNMISELNIQSSEKDKIINSIEGLRNDLNEAIDDLKAKSEEYDKLLDDLLEMRKAMNQMVFKGRWKIIKLLMK